MGLIPLTSILSHKERGGSNSACRGAACSQHEGSPVELVRVCQTCGHFNPADDTERCNNCWLALTGVTGVSRKEAEQGARRDRFHLRRRSHLLLGLALAIGLFAWWMIDLFDVAPLVFPPAGATTSLSASVGPQTWAHARRTPQNTGFTPDPVPLPQKVRWTYATSEPLITSPAVADGRVYFTTEDGRTIALDAQRGQTVWEWEYPGGGFPSSSTPVIAGGLVIFGLRPGMVIALDREAGTLRWERDIGAPILASPVVVNGSVYIGSADKKLYALDAATGQQRWGFATKDWIISSVAYADDTVVVASTGNLIYVVDTSTGRRRLVYDTGRGRGIGTGGPAIQGDMMYLGSKGGKVWAIDRRAITYPFGRGILYWKTNLYAWGVTSKAPVQKGSVWASPVVGDITGTPAVAHDTVYATSRQGKVFALDSTTGNERWTTDLDVAITAAPTVAGETVLIGTKNGIVFGLDADTGEVVWEFKTGDKITGSPIVVGDTMYVVSHDGKLYAITGAE